MDNRISNKSKLWSIIIMLVLGCLFIVPPVLAAGDGTGGGKDVLLDMVSSSPADGQKDVPLTGDIKLTFNKNVIYLLIRDANKKCFSLSTTDGSKVPIEVIMADDQTPEGFEQRRDISVRPLQKLQPGTAYIVRVTPELQAKNGMSLGHEVTVKFVTAGTATKPAEPDKGSDSGKTQPDAQQPVLTPAENIAAQTNESIQPAAQQEKPAEQTVQPAEVKVQSPEVKVPLAEEKAQSPEPKQNASDEKAVSSEADKSKPDSDRTLAVVVGLILIAGVGYFNKVRRK